MSSEDWTHGIWGFRVWSLNKHRPGLKTEPPYGECLQTCYLFFFPSRFSSVCFPTCCNKCLIVLLSLTQESHARQVKSLVGEGPGRPVLTTHQRHESEHEDQRVRPLHFDINVYTFLFEHFDNASKWKRLFSKCKTDAESSSKWGCSLDRLLRTRINKEMINVCPVVGTSHRLWGLAEIK